jgi:hypothetical protein
VTVPSEAPGTWGTCPFCGVAVPYGAAKCPECGTAGPLSARQISVAPKRRRYWLKFIATARTLIVVGVIGVLAYATLSAVWAGPPVLTGDPLTTNAGYMVAPGNFTVVSGEITGGDFVVGNYSSYDPVGMNIVFVIYNNSQWDAFRTGGLVTPTYEGNVTSSGRIVYSAPVTDDYYFVFTNPYPISSHLTIGIFVATQYESNVANDGGV